MTRSTSPGGRTFRSAFLTGSCLGLRKMKACPSQIDSRSCSVVICIGFVLDTSLLHSARSSAAGRFYLWCDSLARLSLGFGGRSELSRAHFMPRSKSSRRSVLPAALQAAPALSGSRMPEDLFGGPHTSCWSGRPDAKERLSAANQGSGCRESRQVEGTPSLIVGAKLYD